MASRVKRLTRAEQQQRTRDAILDAALELFVERGIDATSIEEVTAAAGFSRGAFYSNFSSKPELILDAGKRFVEQLHMAARPPGDQPADAGVAYRERLERMRSVVNDSASVLIAELSLYAIRNPEAREAIAAIHQQQLEPAVRFVETTLANAGIDPPPVDPTTLANVAQAMTFGLHLLGQFDPLVAAEEFVATGMGLLVAGLQREQPDKPGPSPRKRAPRSR